MKKTFSILIISATLMMGVSSCSHYKSINNATKMVELARNPFIKRLALSVMHDMNRAAGTSNKIGLTSSFSEIVPSTGLNEFYSILSSKYHIAPQTIQDYAPTWRKVRDVIAFVAKEGSGFEFYKW